MSAALLQFGALKLALTVALAALAWMAGRTWHRPQVSHGAWLLVLVTMLLPTVLSVPLIEWSSPVSPSALSAPNGDAVVRGEGVDGTLTIASTLVALWAAGSLIVLVVSVTRIVRFALAVRRAAHPISDRVRRIAGDATRAVGLSGYRLQVADAAIPPLAWWTGGSPSLVLPARLVEELADDQLRCLIAHEAAHVRRGDHVTRWIEWLVVIGFWWNPITWIARRALRAAEETCCDEIVLSRAGTDRRSYASALVHVVEMLSLSPPPPMRKPALAVGAVTGGRLSALERRLHMIMNANPRPSMSRGLRAGLMITGAAIASLAMVDVASSAIEPTPVTPVAQKGECDDIVATVKAAIASGKISAEVGKRRIAECLQKSEDKELAAKIERAVRAGEITKQDAADKLSAVRAERARSLGIASDNGKGKGAKSEKANMEKLGAVAKEMGVLAEKLKVSQLEAQVKAEVAAGVLTPDQGKAKLAQILDERKKADGPTAADCAKARTAVELQRKTGDTTARGVLEKVAKGCEKR